MSQIEEYPPDSDSEEPLSEKDAQDISPEEIPGTPTEEVYTLVDNQFISSQGVELPCGNEHFGQDNTQVDPFDIDSGRGTEEACNEGEGE